MKYVLLTLLIELLSMANSVAQIQLFEQYDVSYLNIMTGLPNNFVNDIFMDSRGFVWIATQSGGLVRYDGYNCYFGTRIQGLSLRSNSCRNLTEDRFHRLWVSFDEGTSIVDLDMMRQVMPKVKPGILDLNKIISERSVRVMTDSKGCIWLVTMGYIYRIAFNNQGEVVQILSFSYKANTPDVIITDIDQDGCPWVCLNSTLVKLKAQGGRLQVAKTISSLKNTGIAFLSALIKYQGKYWLGTNHGLYIMNPNGTVLKAFRYTGKKGDLSHDFISCLSVFGKSLLVGTYCGIDVLQVGKTVFDVWDVCHKTVPLSSNFIHCISNSHGNLWIGTESGGITKLSPRQLLLTNYIHSDNPASISPNAVNSMLIDSRQQLWVGTVEGGLNMKKSGESSFLHINKSNSALTHNSVSCLTTDGRNMMWVGTWGGGVHQMQIDYPQDIRPLQIPAKFQESLLFVGTLTYDRINNGLWIGTNDGLFFYNFKSNSLEQPFLENRTIRGCIGSIITRGGMLYVGCVEGMVVVDLKSRKSRKGYFSFRHIRHKLDNPKSKIIDKICSFYEAKDGTLWLGSNGYGLYKRVVNKNGKVSYENYSMAQGLSNNSVKGIVEDQKGNLWITTDYGLTHLNPKTGVFTKYTEDDGLISSQFYFNSAVKSPFGALYLGTTAGLIQLNGENVERIYKGHLRFTGLTIDQREAYAGSRFLKEDISIAHDIYLHESDKAFMIDFSTLNFGSETQGVYSYRLKGFDNDWIQLQPGQHSVRYTSLPSGDYTFEVKYSSVLQTDENSISINVHVIPYFWKSWWFFLLILLLVVVIARYLYKRRIKVLHDREVEKLYRPLEVALKESNEPGKLQTRIQEILQTQKRYAESQSKSVEATLKEVEKNNVPFMERVMCIVEENYQNSEFGVSELGDQLGMSRSALSRKLTNETGDSTAQFLRRYRLEVASKLLLDATGGRNITEIAYSVGFNDPKYFTRCFSKQYGVSPSAYNGETPVN